jgi:hypothetical protein
MIIKNALRWYSERAAKTIVWTPTGMIIGKF